MARLPFWIVAASLCAVLALVLLYPGPLLAPGPLMRAHSELEADCFACHQPFFGSTPEKCASCHRPDQIGRFTTRGAPVEGRQTGFHQELVDQNCLACHTDQG